MFPGLFRGPKNNGNHKMILKLKTFNGFLKFKLCKLDSVEDAPELITEGCYFESAKLKDVSYTNPFHENYQKYLKLFRKDEYHQYIVLTTKSSKSLYKCFDSSI